MVDTLKLGWGTFKSRASYSMKNKTVFLSGASSDIGTEVARIYVHNGYRVLAHFLNGSERFEEFIAKHKEVATIRSDFSSVEGLDDFLTCHKKELEDCDVFVNAVGLLEDISYEAFSASDLVRSLTANTVSSVLISRLIGAAMSRRKWGRIVHLGSIGVKYGGGPNSYCYSLSKHALEFFPAEIRKWARSNVFVNTIRVGVTDTKIHSRIGSKKMEERLKLIPTGRMATASEMAHSIYWIGSEMNTYMTGQVITIAGGE